jgi:hypothetical protein
MLKTKFVGALCSQDNRIRTIRILLFSVFNEAFPNFSLSAWLLALVSIIVIIYYSFISQGSSGKRHQSSFTTNQ